MALPVPTIPLTIPVFGAVNGQTGRIVPAVGNEDRGAAVINIATNSTVTHPSLYVENDQCDTPAYLVGSISMTIQQNTEDCRSVLGATVSIKARVPNVAGAGQDFNTLVDQAQTLLSTAIIGRLNPV